MRLEGGLLLLLLAVLVSWLCTGFEEGNQTVRRVGMTEFARAEYYDPFTVTEEHRREFFRDGATQLKKVLRPELVDKLRKLVAPKIQSTNATTSSNLWMDADELLDFYLHAPLGSIAAQIFQSPEAVTGHLPASAQLSRDFISRRHHDWTNGWHIDRTECQGGDQPSKYLATALPRLAIPLDFGGAGGVRGTWILNQSRYAAAMSQEDAELYWSGRSPYRREGRFEPDEGFKYSTSVPVLPGMEGKLTEDMIMEHWMEPGDVVIFNTCLWHRSPPWAGPGIELGLQPTFAPSSHVSRDPPIALDVGGSGCDSGLGAKSVADGSPCLPVAFPEEARPARGSTLNLHRNPTPKLRHVMVSRLGMRARDELRSLGPKLRKVVCRYVGMRTADRLQSLGSALR